jgi:dTDP-D-glucose 4,6-dehydratase
MTGLFCFGFGYSARALARRCDRLGQPAVGTTRDGRDDTIMFDGETSETQRITRALAEASHVLLAIPPDAQGDAVLRCFGPALADLPKLVWLGYLSTTGVYGDHAGGWVTEDTPPAPLTERGRRRLAAEQAWRGFAAETGAPLHIFRLPGIYGPGRSLLEAVRGGTARNIVKPGHVFSRIHVDDLAAALAASMARPQPGALYNVCDDEPAPRHEVLAFACDLLGVPVPPGLGLEEAGLDVMAASFYGENKRVSSDRIKAGLSLTWRYPSYREGLRAIASTMSIKRTRSSGCDRR